MGDTERNDDVATNHEPEEPWWMFFLWPWSRTYGAGPTGNFIGRMGYGFFLLLGIGLIVTAIQNAF